MRQLLNAKPKIPDDGFEPTAKANLSQINCNEILFDPDETTAYKDIIQNMHAQLKSHCQMKRSQ